MKTSKMGNRHPNKFNQTIASTSSTTDDQRIKKEHNPEKTDALRIKKERYDPEKTEDLRIKIELYDRDKTDALGIKKERIDPEKTDDLRIKKERYDPEKTDDLRIKKERYDPEKTDDLRIKKERYDPEKTDDLRIKIERYDPEVNSMCRVCLQEGNIPIYGDEIFDDLSEALCTFGDITVSSDDKHTKFLCQFCYDFLLEAITFREKAKRITKSKMGNHHPKKFNNETISSTLKTDDLRIKKEHYDPEVNSMCRVCLKDGKIPIFGDGIFDDVSEALCTFGDITVSSDDNHTKFLCQSCYDFLQEAITFRKKAKQSEQTPRLQQSYQSRNFFDNNEYVNNSNDSSNEFEDQIDNNYYCTKCNKDFNSSKEYSEHRLSSEHENMKYKCPICNKLYVANYIKKHMLLHKIDQQYMCDICGKKFSQQPNFKRHRAIHNYSLPFQCTLCPYKGRFKDCLKVHMRTHTGEKPYQCPHCPLRFTNASNLNKHKPRHNRDHKFKCDMCEKGFYNRRDMVSHFKADHSGVKEYICNICKKAFGHRNQMMKHQRKVHKRQKLKSGMPLYLQVESQNKDTNE